MELWPKLQESLVVHLSLDEEFGINLLQISVAFGESVVWYKFVDHIFVASFIAKWSTGNAMQTAIETGKYEEFLQRGRAKGEIAAQLKSFSRIW